MVLLTLRTAEFRRLCRRRRANATVVQRQGSTCVARDGPSGKVRANIVQKIEGVALGDHVGEVHP